MQWLTFTSGVTGNSNLFGSSSFWASNAREMYMAHSAFQSYDKLVGNPSAVFQKWLAHPVPDAYYDAMVPSPEQYKKISLPILTITGHYDGDQPGAFTYYKRHMQYGTPEAKAKPMGARRAILGSTIRWIHAPALRSRRTIPII